MRTAIQQADSERHFRPVLGSLREPLPNDLVARLRTRLAESHVVEVTHAIVFATVARPMALTAAETDL
ncbi:hypothetical protein [Paractinoplanes hotanensis]|uniref:Uncharacterized protein n=1 Tax=Paractinoplanes hotanensis TaxID=2906497 RepID=A0ABT0YE05_9ACTN|nr:hypothetical protein [Actinoplanes hotanensis]MCM4084283.1 hypothetical protein [Actinoplanes hotanensis]